MTRFVIRLWLPDKPGALGRVASAIGSVGASLVGIEILEQGGGSAIDELIVEAVDSSNAAEKLVAALSFVDGVSVEDIRSVGTGVVTDPRVDALESATELVGQTSVSVLYDVLVRRARHDLSADWAVVVEHGAPNAIADTGNAPSSQWLKAFVAGTRTSSALAAGHIGAEDVAHVELLASAATLLVGREGRPFRLRERRQLEALSRLADALASRLDGRATQ